ncbi:hypothetical protein [Actinomadura macrotermitis]|uniref:Uncharacterized protein n=1 Tax=Actinomadura macrotermitis TaxID=2585200 RepID=A0A7K0BR28_9ACTN|nr:hypothetical protein [Actinomadura macrotermitis]MQY03645.1 hypothetical protein [Actinomadura macrotermitis]
MAKIDVVDLDLWEGVRRYAVPHHVIERAARRRAAGDWRGACEAAGFTVDVDLARMKDVNGQEVADAVEEDLRRLAPDLLLWHAPRDETGRLVPGERLVLAGYGERWFERGGMEYTPALCVELPGRWNRWRLILEAGPDGRFDQDWTGLRCLWDADRAAELPALEGADRRLPFFEPDGRVRDPGLLPRRHPGPAAPVERAEWITLLQESDRSAEAFAAAGYGLLSLHAAAGHWTGRWWWDSCAVHKLPGLVRLLQERPPGHRRLRLGDYGPVVTLAEDGTLRGEIRDLGDSAQRVADPWWRPSPDLALVRAGRLTPGELHPLVGAALFPGQAGGPRPPRAPIPATVRCQGEEHQVWFENGELRTCHTAAERQREEALAAIGGPRAGCFAVPRTWGDLQRGPMPPELADQRDELFGRMAHGDAEGVLRMLELGHDPSTRDREGRFLADLLPARRSQADPRLAALLDVPAPWHRAPRAGLRRISGPPAADPWPLLQQLGQVRWSRLSQKLNEQNLPEVLRDTPRIDLLIRVVDGSRHFDAAYARAFWDRIGVRLRAALGTDPQVWFLAAERLPVHRGRLDDLPGRLWRPAPRIGPVYPDMRVLAQAPPEVLTELGARLGVDDFERALDHTPHRGRRYPKPWTEPAVDDLRRRAGLPPKR